MPPGTLPQLIIALLFVIPGVVYQAVRSRYVGTLPQERETADKLLRALGVSAVLHASYLILFGSSLIRLIRPRGTGAFSGVEANPRLVGLLGLALLVAVPAALAWTSSHRRLIVGWLLTQLEHDGADGERPDSATAPSGRKAGNARWKRLRLHLVDLLARWRPLPDAARYSATPTAWDWATDKVWGARGFVRVLKKDGRWVGGAYGSDSYVSSYPEPPAIYVETGYQIAASGEFRERQESTRGLWVSCEDAIVVEFLGPAPAVPIHPQK